MIDLAKLSRSLDADMAAQDFEPIFYKTSKLLERDPDDWRLNLYKAIALNGMGRRSEALQLLRDYLYHRYQPDVLVSMCRMVLGQGGGYGELMMLRSLFERHAARVDGDEPLRFRAETDFHLGERDRALAAMRKLPQGVVPEHYFQQPPLAGGRPIDNLVADAHIGDVDAVYRNFDSIRRSAVPGTADDGQLVSIVGRLERHEEVRERLKRALFYDVSGAKLDATRPLIIETMLYSGEEHLLELHLHSMPFVDHFIVVQGDRSFTGIPKETYPVVGNPRFAAFAQKLTSIVIRFASFDDPLLQFPWFVEALHRNAAHATLLKDRDCDTHVISDVDEVIKSDVIESFKQNRHELAAVRIREHKFFLNFQRFGVGDYRQMTLPTMTTLVSGKMHAASDPHTIRNFLARDSVRQNLAFLDGGWHFSSVVDAEGLKAKYNNYSHVENTAKKNEVSLYEQFREDMRAPGDLGESKKRLYSSVGLPIEGFVAMPINLQTYPKYIVENQKSLESFILPVATDKSLVETMLMLNRRSQEK